MTTLRIVFSAAFIVLLSQTSIAEDVKPPADPAVIQQKIAALGLRDDTIAYDEKPEPWLKLHRDQAIHELISNLDNTELRIAAGCLKVLDGLTGSDKLLNALLRIADDEDHFISAKVTLSLCPFAADRRARKILKKAVNDNIKFPDHHHRASIALALGDKPKAVKLKIEFLADEKNKYKISRIIKQLGEIGDDSAVPFLANKSKDKCWDVARESYLALAKIDDKKFGLTEDQVTFLKKAGRSFKANRPTYLARWKEMSKLDKNQIRPFVMQMLDSDNPQPALTILQTWRDTESIPEIKRIMITSSKWQCREFIAPYLDLEGTDKSITEIIELVTNKNQRPKNLRVEDAVHCVWRYEMSNKRKLQILRRFRDAFGPVPVSRFFSIDTDGIEDIATAMISEETDIIALGNYARSAGQDTQKRFAAEVRDALTKLATLETISKKQANSALSILQAAAVYKLKEVGKLTDRLLSTQYPINIQLAAAKLSANHGGDRTKALQFLYKELASTDPYTKKQTCDIIAKVKCVSESERAEREQILLAHFGKKSEAYAIRLLITCPGKKSQQKLTARLDSTDIPRALSAAWTLAQYPDENIKNKAIRRIAIYAMFNHSVYQQGSGIDFKIAHDLYFHQLTSWMKPQSLNHKRRTKPVVIPRQLLVPFTLDEQEQAFSILAYSHAHLNRDQIIFSHPNIFYGWSRRNDGWDTSHIPLLKTVTAENPYLSILHIKGKEIAHFVLRKTAAEIIADITGREATYKGIDGKNIESDKTPMLPYKDQTKLMAAFLLDQIQANALVKHPSGGFQWEKIGVFKMMIRVLLGDDRHALGDDLKVELKAELIAESQKRNITEKLKKVGFTLWRNLK